MEKKLVWIDLEMTGLNPDEHVIIEVAAIVTDEKLNIIDEGLNIVIHHPDETMLNLSDWIVKTHGESGLLAKVQESKISLSEAEKLVLNYLILHCAAGASPLCGNSVWQDRRFLIKYMPALNNFFHYRNIDVSTIKELVSRWYGFKYKKGEVHRALGDVLESIAELKYYRDNFFVK